MSKFVQEYRVTAANERGRASRTDVSGAGSPFREDDPIWSNFAEEGLFGAYGLAQLIAADAKREGRKDVRIERRLVGEWEPA